MSDMYLPQGREPDVKKDPEACELPYIDVQDGIKRVMGNKALYMKLLGKFAGRQIVDGLIGDIREKDYRKIEQSAHTLKGLSANLGMQRLRYIAAEIESRAKENVDAAYIIADLSGTLEATMKVVDKLTM